MRTTRRTKQIILIFLAVSLFISLITSFFYSGLEIDSYSISCYYEAGGEIVYLDDRFQPRNDSIFFHETSCKGGLNSRQACSVEAVARWNPSWDIYVLFLAPVRDLQQKSLVTLRRYKNIKLLRLNFEHYTRGTPVDKLVTSGAWMRTKWRISHTSDLVRYLTLYKWGGIYLDLDSVVVKPLGRLAPNWVARESDVSLGAAAMAFSNDALGREIAEQTIRDLVRNWRGDIWGNNGPGVISRVLTDLCLTMNIKRMNAEICKGFEVYSPEQFYPIEWKYASQYFEPPNTTYPNAYIYHIWNHLTKHEDVFKGSLYDLIAKEHCPYIYNVYGEDFGK